MAKRITKADLKDPVTVICKNGDKEVVKGYVRDGLAITPHLDLMGRFVVTHIKSGRKVYPCQGCGKTDLRSCSRALEALLPLQDWTRGSITVRRLGVTKVLAAIAEAFPEASP